MGKSAGKKTWEYATIGAEHEGSERRAQGAGLRAQGAGRRAQSAV